MKRMFESKLDRLSTDIMSSVDTKVRALRDELSVDLASETRRVDQVLTTIQSIQSRMDGLEQQRADHNTIVNGTNNMGNTQQNDPEVSVTVSGIQETENENSMAKITDLIQALGDEVYQNINIANIVRLPSRVPGRPGIIRISFRSTTEKVRVLRNKRRLKGSVAYKNVYTRSSKSRIERLTEMNARAVLRQLPDGRTLRVDASGRIQQRKPNERQDQQVLNDETPLGTNRSNYSVKLGNINICGWTRENCELRKNIFSSMECDIICVCETHLAKDGIIEVPGFSWF